MIVVTGGAGFIGSNTVAALEEAGAGPVSVVDRLGHDDKWKNLRRRDLDELVDPEALGDFLERRLRDIEYVIHMGAISATTETDADLIAETNLRLPQYLWRWCTRHEVPFLYASSAATYGDGSAGFDDNGSPEALAHLVPMNAYGWSKLAFDKWVAHVATEGEAKPPQWVGLRFFNVYGPNEYHKGSMMSVVAQKLPLAVAGQPVTLFKSCNPEYPDGGQRRDFIFVDDCVDVVLWLLDNPHVNGLFNLGTGIDRSFAALARAIFTALDREPEIAFIDMPEAIRDRYQYFTRAQMERLRAAGYDRAFTSLEDGVGSYVKDYLIAADPYR